MVIYLLDNVSGSLVWNVILRLHPLTHAPYRLWSGDIWHFRLVVRLVFIFLFETNDNDNKHLAEFDISCGITEDKNMTTVFF